MSPALEVVLTDDLSCAKDVEMAKLAFLKQFNSLYHKFCFADKNVLLNFFWSHAMSFYNAGIWGGMQCDFRLTDQLEPQNRIS